MRHSINKLKDANVVAAFYIQDEADGALYGLRSLGIRDQQIGYYAPAGNGEMRDFLAQYHRFAASLVWGIMGACAGALAAWVIIRGGTNVDPWGLKVTMGVCSALFFGTYGGMMGLTRPGPGAFARVPQGMPETYFMAVNAGPARNEVLSLLRQHGGHEIEPNHGSQAVLAG